MDARISKGKISYKATLCNLAPGCFFRHCFLSLLRGCSSLFLAFLFGFSGCLKAKTMCCKCSDYKNCDGKTDCTTTPQQLRWLCVLACCGSRTCGRIGWAITSSEAKGRFIISTYCLGCSLSIFTFNSSNPVLW